MKTLLLITLLNMSAISVYAADVIIQTNASWKSSEVRAVSSTSVVALLRFGTNYDIYLQTYDEDCPYTLDIDDEGAACLFREEGTTNFKGYVKSHDKTEKNISFNITKIEDDDNYLGYGNGNISNTTRFEADLIIEESNGKTEIRTFHMVNAG